MPSCPQNEVPVEYVYLILLRNHHTNSGPTSNDMLLNLAPSADLHNIFFAVPFRLHTGLIHTAKLIANHLNAPFVLLRVLLRLR